MVRQRPAGPCSPVPQPRALPRSVRPARTWCPGCHPPDVTSLGTSSKLCVVSAEWLVAPVAAYQGRGDTPDEWYVHDWKERVVKRMEGYEQGPGVEPTGQALTRSIDTEQSFVKFFMQASSYIMGHRGKTFVVVVPGAPLPSPLLLPPFSSHVNRHVMPCHAMVHCLPTLPRSAGRWWW